MEDRPERDGPGQKEHPLIFRALTSALLTAACAASATVPQGSERRLPGTGVALTPAHFPKHGPEDVEAMFRKGKELGDYAVFIYQWSQSDVHDAARAMIDSSRKRGLTPLVALSPTVLSGLRGELDVPAAVRSRVKGKLSFALPEVHLPYIKAVLDLAQLKPPYLCLATEINLLAFQDVQEYVTFAHVYKKLYPEIKKVSPDTKVFVSFQWDFMRILDRKEPDKVAEHRKLIDIFRPELDLVALTSYPADHFETPNDVSADYYSRVFDHVSGSEMIILMEIGWPSAGKGSAAEQKEFVERLPSLMENVRPQILAWSLLHDVGGTALGGDLSSTGLMTQGGEAKPAYAAFKAISRR